MYSTVRLNNLGGPNMHHARSIKLIFPLIVVLSLILSACAPKATEAPVVQENPTEEVVVVQTAAPEETEAATTDAAANFKVAFIYSSPIGDMGWTYGHDQARQILEKELGVETAYAENVAEGSADAERVIRDFAEKGYNAIFACSFGYLDAMANAAKDYPDTNFLALSGYQVADNLGNYVGRNYQARYLSGIVAGLMTETDLLGYVAGVPIPDVIVEINSFTMGARSVNPDVKVRVVWTDSWYDPVKETEAANALLEQGADILTYHANTASTLTAAAEKGKYGIGYPTDMSKVAPETVLTSTNIFWESYYVDAVKRMLEGTWKGESIYWGIEHNMVGLAPYNDKVPQSVKDAVDASIQSFKDGTFEVWWGPIYGQGGKLAIPEGKKLTDEEIRSIDWFVDGVEGTAPNTPPVVE
jgi:basic membrane protein A